jgi:hypothetical protein
VLNNDYFIVGNKVKHFTKIGSYESFQ